MDMVKSYKARRVFNVLGIILISSPFVGFLIILPTVAGHWDVALPGYALGLGVCGIVCLGVWLLAKGKRRDI